MAQMQTAQVIPFPAPCNPAIDFYAVTVYDYASEEFLSEYEELTWQEAVDAMKAETDRGHICEIIRL